MTALQALQGPEYSTLGRNRPDTFSKAASFVEDGLTSDDWIESNDSDNFVKGGFLYEKGFWGRKVRRLVLTEKSLRLLHKRTGIVKRYYGLYSVISVEPQRNTFCFIVTFYNAKGRVKRLYFQPSSAQDQREWIKAIKLCVAVVKATKEERDNARIRSRSSSFSVPSKSIGWGVHDDREGAYGRGWETSDGRRSLLSKSYTTGDLHGCGRIDERMADEHNDELSPFDSAEQWELGQREHAGQMGIPAGKSSFTRHAQV